MAIKAVKDKTFLWFIGTGVVIGILAVILMKLGNPPNMGICVACFLRDTAGALGLDGAVTVQYIRPEIAGLLLGSFVLALFRREWKPSGGSAPLARFAIAFFVMIGALVFLGCPLRLALRLAAGDLNALVGLAGFAAGIALGSFMLRKGFSLGDSRPQGRANGLVMPLLVAVLLVFLLLRPVFIKFSAEGPGSMHAPVIVSLGAALIIGALAQRSSLCMSGGIRNLILIKNPTMLFGYLAIFVAAFAANLAAGNFKPGFAGQPIAHTMALWNFLGMALSGYGSILLGGCPLRQLIMAGEGNSDAGVCILGFLVAAATAHNFGIAASPNGVPANGQIAVIIGFVVLTAIALLSTKKNTAAA
ncbi:MAG: YedE-related selenium metabolism membrane protein [Spirochaetaceae bacterium]|jgi:YedE family putative selenium metabolism protein|nr:YedE-related selenium metabolism membrane protein [Spirochaetaceae bacterium]